jgi:probable HAF family extracellular repeat protein
MAVFRSWPARILATLALLLITALQNERTAAQSAAYALTDLGVIAVQSAEAHDVNDAGQAVGNSGNKAFLWQNGAMTDLGSLGGTTSFAYAINGVGQIVGQSSTPNNAARHAALWDHGAIVDLLPGVAYSRATAINDLREIVGETGTFAFLGATAASRTSVISAAWPRTRTTSTTPRRLSALRIRTRPRRSDRWRTHTSGRTV